MKQSFLSDSFIGRLLQELCFPLTSEILLLLSVILFWYEGAFPTYSLATITLVLALVFADKSKIKIGKSTIYFISFFVLAQFSGVLAVWNGVNPRLVIMGWLLFTQFLIAILAAQGVAKPYRLLKNVLISSVPMILVGAYQFVAQQPTSSLWVSPAEASISTRAFAFFGSPNVLGAVLAVVALAAAGVYLETKNKVIALTAVFSTLVLVFTFSRSAWIGFVVGAIVMLIIRNYKLLFLAPLALIVFVFAQVRDRVAVLFTPGYTLDSSLDGRLWALNNGFHIWAKYPLIGSGPGTYGGKLALNAASPVYLQGIQQGYVALYYTDNQWLQLLVQTGIVGVILFALFSVNILIELVSKYNVGKSWVALGVSGAFVAFCITGIFGNVLEFGAIAVPMGIMLGVATSGK